MRLQEHSLDIMYLSLNCFTVGCEALYVPWFWCYKWNACIFIVLYVHNCYVKYWYYRITLYFRYFVQRAHISEYCSDGGKSSTHKQDDILTSVAVRLCAKQVSVIRTAGVLCITASSTLIKWYPVFVTRFEDTWKSSQWSWTRNMWET